MVRYLFLFTLICFVAQAEAAEPSHFFLIDNSASMVTHRDDVEKEVLARLQELPQTDSVSITYAQGIHVDDCDTVVAVGRVQEIGLVSALNPPSSSGSTIVSKAITTLLELQYPTVESVTIYTDGKYDESRCETPDDICGAIGRLSEAYPSAAIDLKYPPKVRGATGAVLACTSAVMGKGDRGDLGGTETLKEEESGAADALADRHYPTVIAWFSLPLLLVLLIGSLAYSRRFQTARVRESLEPNDNDEATDQRIRWFRKVVLVTIVGALTALIFYSFGEGVTWASWLFFYEHANKPLMSIVMAWAVSVAGGWYFVERLSDLNARTTKKWRVNFKADKDRRDREIQERYEEGVSGALDKTLDRYEQIIRVQVFDVEETEAKTQVEEVWSKAQDHLACLSELIAQLDAKKAKRASTSTYSNPKPILKRLVTEKLIEQQQADELQRAISAWQQIVRGLPRVDEYLAKQILSTDTEKMRSE